MSDERLVALAATGDERAFEVLYDRHHAALLGFCRHMLGSREEGEDALQQTFLRAHRALLLHGAPDDVRPWLFAIARNRCRSMHAIRKDAATPDDELEPATDGLAADVEQRADLRALLADIERLPEDQRSALVLTELADMSHAEIGTVIGVPASKVKALVHQARTHLIAEREARETPCEEIREQLATARGGELRRGALRRHLNRCESCRAYRTAVTEQRVALGLLLPVIPSAGLKQAVLGAIGGGGGGAAAAAGGAAGGLTGASSMGLGAKLAVGAALLGSAGGGVAIVETAVHERPAAKQQATTATTAGAGHADKRGASTTLVDAAGTGAAVRAGAALGGRAAARKPVAGKPATRHGKRKAHAYGKARNGNRGTRNHGAAAGQNGNAKALGRTGQAGSGGQGGTRSAAAHQRNVQRKATRVETKSQPERTAVTKPERPVPQAKPKPVKPVPTPAATIEPVATPQVVKPVRGNSQKDAPANAVEPVVTP
jgi:RNA polymerase sigma factor (sigma-70 family)